MNNGATEKLKHKVFESFKRLLPAGAKTLVVAVSGGADSLALTFLAHEYAMLKGYAVEAVTVDHGLRAESKAEADEVARLLKAHNISHHTLVWCHEENPNRCHEKAREARYRLLIEFCKNYPQAALLTAHHVQDQVETILMRFLKGSGAAGFQGVQALRYENDIPIIRPLLEIAPGVLREYLAERGIEWIEDPSNVNPHYERTRIRQLAQHIKDLGWQEEGILTSALKIYQLHQSLENLVNGYAAQFVIFADPLTVDQKAFFKCDLFIQKEWLRNKVWTIGEGAYPKPYSTINAVLEMLKQPKVNGYKIAGCKIDVGKRQIVIKKQQS